jgi:hypothetical protein
MHRYASTFNVSVSPAVSRLEWNIKVALAGWSGRQRRACRSIRWRSVALLFWVLTHNPRVVSTQCDPFQTPSLRFSLVRAKIKPWVARITQRHHSQMKLTEALLLTERNKSKLITTDHEEKVTFEWRMCEQCGHRNVTETIIVFILFMYYSPSTPSSHFYFIFLLSLIFFVCFTPSFSSFPVSSSSASSPSQLWA